MARKPRVEFPGAFYHVIARGNHRQTIFHDDADRRHYLKRLEHYRTRYDLTIYAYVLMTNHVHILVETAEIPLSKIMQGLHCAYTRFYNWRYRQVGHLFQGRYKANLCDRDAYLLELVRYLHLNPARLQAPVDPWQYPWSSHRAYMGEPSLVTVETSVVLRQFGTRIASARHAYVAFLAQGLPDGHSFTRFQARDGQFSDDGEFTTTARPELRHARPLDGPARPVPFDRLLRAVAQAHGVEPDLLLLRDHRRRWMKARAMLVYLAREWSGLGIHELGLRFRRDPSTVSRLYAHYADGRDPSTEARVEAWLRQNANNQA